MARPTIFSEELGDLICERIARGESVRKICKDESMPARKTVHLWFLDENKKEFLHKYEIACDIRADELFDELEEIADIPDTTESPMRSRLRVDTRKWYLSKVLPKKFGEKIDVTSGGEKIDNITRIEFMNHEPKGK